MKPKILFILHYPPPVHGAAMVGQLIKESTLINSSFETKYIRLGTTNTFKERKKTTVRKIFRFINLLIKCFMTNLSYRPNLVYLSMTSRGMGFYKDMLIVSVLKLSKAKLVYHFHNKGVRNRMDKSFDNWLYKAAFKNVEVILLSENLYLDIEKYLPKEKVHFCSNGIPEIQRQLKMKADRDGNPTEILFLSNLIETKGIFILLAALKLLKDRQIYFRCTFVGGEGDISAERLQVKLNQLGLSETVKYVGKKYGIEKEKVYAKSDIFVHPTLDDCFPLVVLEAMQFNLPIISTFEGGIPDIIEEGTTGFLVPKEDEVALANKLEILIKNPSLRRSMGTAGKSKYLEEYTLQKFETNFLKILDQMVLSK